VKAAPPFGTSRMNCTPADYQLQKKRGANNRQEPSNTPLTVQYEIHTSAQPIEQTNWRSTSNNRSMGACKGTFPLRIQQKQCRPSNLQTMNYTPADYRLQKSMGQTTDRNRATLPSLFGMKFTQVPAKNTAIDLQNKPCRPTIQLPCFHLIMVQRDGEKRSWITSGGDTSIGIDWHPFGVLEADDYRQSNRLRFGDKLIFVNYQVMNKKQFK
jgi:hypothetical protein